LLCQNDFTKSLATASPSAKSLSICMAILSQFTTKFSGTNSKVSDFYGFRYCSRVAAKCIFWCKSSSDVS